MGFVDRILGRKHDLDDGAPESAAPHGASSTSVRAADEKAVADYERMLRTAPPDTIEKVHVEAFEKLSPEQLDILYDRFTANASTPEERPADARPATLAKTATDAEQRAPGTLRRVLDEDRNGANLNTWVGLSILDSVIWYSLASTLWTGFDGGYDASDGSDAGPDATGPDATGPDATGYDDPSGGGFDGFGGGFDF